MRSPWTQAVAKLEAAKVAAPPMTEKHFAYLAIALREMVESDPSQNWEDHVDSMADALAATNPRFDRSQFVLSAMGEV